MSLGGGQTEAHRGHGNMGTARLTPGINLRHQIVYAALRKGDKLRAKILKRPVEPPQPIAQSAPGADGAVNVASEEYEAIGKPSGPIKCSLGSPAEPDRDRPLRPRHECGPVDAIKTAREVDHWLGEQPAEKLYLLLLASAARTEVLPQGLVLDVIPAHAHAEAQSPSREKVNIRRLPRHECGLTLWENQDPRGELDSLRDPGQIGEQHERIMKRVVLGVRAGQLARSVGMNRAEDVVVREDVVKTQVLGGWPDLPNRARVPSKLGLRIDNTDAHG